MLLALLADIHANREALESCLQHAQAAGAGACSSWRLHRLRRRPRWVLDTVRTEVERGALAVRGNHDDAVLGRDAGMNASARAAIRWTRGQLDAEQRAFLAALPFTIEEGERLYVHANAWAPPEWGYIFGRVEAERSMRRTTSRIMICGHVHVPAIYYMASLEPARHFAPLAGCAIPLLPRRQWLAVIGAVGQSRDRDPSACYALLDDGEDTINFVRVPYDIDSAARKIVSAGLPHSLAARLYEGR
jgi:diadenosine tetraphosphatase ApaH/serine/threonine PP2A family protein phosphatase